MQEVIVPNLNQSVQQTMISQTCISLESPVEWKNALQGIKHGFAHTWENCHAMRLTTGFKTYLYCFEADGVRIVCPIAEREFEGHIDIVTPYGFSGFVGNDDCADFPHYWREFVRERGYVCGYIGLHPIFENKTYFATNELYSYNNIYVLDLRLSRDQLFSNFHKNRKRDLKQWEKISGNLITDKTALKDFFLANYSEFFERKTATSAYDFCKSTLEFLLELENVVILGAGKVERVEAASTFTYTPGVADGFLHTSLAEGRHHSAALIWYAANYFKSIGIPLLNLGGGVRANDRLAWFKERFGGRKILLSCLKQVYDAAIYAALCAQVGADPADRTGYFPAYRSSQHFHSTA
jgi:hypothetical protein